MGIRRTVAAIFIISSVAWLAGCGGGGGAGGGGVLPTAPNGLQVTGATATSASLAWNDQSTIETGYELQRRTGVGGNFATVANLGANVVAYTDNGLTTGQTYYYRVRALGATGNSDWSAIIGVTAQDGGGGGGGTATVTGRVLRLDDGTPVVGAQVTLGGLFTNAGADGRFTFNNVVAGNYQLQAAATGFLASQSQVQIDAGANNIGDVFLVTSGQGPPPPPNL